MKMLIGGKKYKLKKVKERKSDAQEEANKLRGSNKYKSIRIIKRSIHQPYYEVWAR